MIWSQLKKQIRALMCDELRDRVDFHKAVYRKSWDSLYDRAWITIDGEQVFQLSYGEGIRVWREIFQHVETEHPEADDSAQRAMTDTVFVETNTPFTNVLGTALHRYLEMPIAEALQSADPIVRAFALLDRRTGRRTLARLAIPPDEHPLVRAFYELRMTGV